MNDDDGKLEGGLITWVGVDIKSIQIGTSNDFDIANFLNSVERNVLVHNRVLGFSLAYLFKKIIKKSIKQELHF